MSASDRPTCSRFVSSSSVNDKIIDYYLKYAKDRDIEKFMRFSNSHCRSASSEESEYLVSVHKLYDDHENECPNKFPQNQGQRKSTKDIISVVQADTGTRTSISGSDLVQPPDSVTKNDKKLEWDSLGDVGYRKANSTGNISSLERSVLKELFSDSPSDPNISLQRSNEIQTSSTNSVAAQNKREKWRETLETLGKKYSSFSASLDTQEFMEQPQSTPKLLPNTEKSCQTTFNKRKVEPRQKDLSIQTTIDRTLRRALSVEPRQKDLSIQSTLGQRSSRPSQKDEPIIGPSAHTRKEERSSRQSSITEPRHVDHSTQTSRHSSNAAPNLVNHSAQTSFDQRSSRRSLIRDSNHVDHSAQTSFDQRYYRRLQNSEKYCQTSLAKLRSQEVQANLSSRTGSFATQSSFEYFAGESTSSKSSGRSVLNEKNSTHNTKSRPSLDSDKENQLTRRSIKSKNGLDLGIKLLCSLIDAKNLTATQKKSLAKKIFEKIVKQQSGTSTSASLTSTSSVFSVPSIIDSSSPCENKTNRNEVVAVFKDKGKSKSMPKLSEETQTDSPKEIEESPPKITSPMEAPTTSRKVTEERRTATPKVSDENPLTTSSSLDEPVTMREWLHPLTRSEKDYDKKMKKKSNQEVSPQVSERQKQLSWIETEINRLEGLKNLLIQERSPSNVTSNSSKSTVQSTGRAEVIYEETTEAVVNPVDKYKRTTQRTSENVVIYDEPTADNVKQPEKVEYKTTRVVINEEQLTSSSGSMKNHRSKLETPVVSPDCGSVSAFANQLQKQFMDSYSKKERCMSEHYSEPRECGKPVFTRNPSYTSVASSAFCMSSEMSIPIVESSSTSTTTHQYDSNGCESVEGVAVQTTYSVIKTNPIFGPRCQCVCRCGVQCKCSCPRPTVRVSGNVFHQTVQVKPKALAYVIRFGETHDDYEKKANEECLSLQQRLEMQNPDFCSKAEKRREILKKLHNLRQQREQQIREIADNSNVSSILRNLDQLPSPPIKNVRVLPTREMKRMTNKRYRKLPEVVAKQELEKLERRKRSTRVLTRIFNKKLQRMVHNGKLSLEYSRTVI